MGFVLSPLVSCHEYSCPLRVILSRNEGFRDRRTRPFAAAQGDTVMERLT